MGKLVPLAVIAVALTPAGLAAAAATGDTYTYRAALTTGGEVPKPKAPASAKGTFTATVVESGKTASIRWTLTFRGLSGKAAAAHIHKGKPGLAGAVLVPLCGPCTSGKAGRATITKTAAELMATGRAYVNVHTAKNTGGEIRGQVKLVTKQSTNDQPPPSGGDSDDSGNGGNYPPSY